MHFGRYNVTSIQAIIRKMQCRYNEGLLYKGHITLSYNYFFFVADTSYLEIGAFVYLLDTLSLEPNALAPPLGQPLPALLELLVESASYPRLDSGFQRLKDYNIVSSQGSFNAIQQRITTGGTLMHTCDWPYDVSEGWPIRHRSITVSCAFHKAVIDRCQICIGLQFQDCKPVCFYSPKHSRNTGYQHVRGTEVCLPQSQRQLKPQFWNGIITYWKDNWAFFILKNQEICISMWWVVVTVSLHF